jgi:Two component regulator propeller
VATDGGLCLFNPFGTPAPPNTNQQSPMFTVYRVSEREETNHVNGLIEDPDGSLWLATSGGLFHFRRTGGFASMDAVEIGYPAGMREERHVTKLFFDSRGALWTMAISGLYRRPPGGPWERYGVEQGLRNSFVQSMFEDKRGRLWLGSRSEGLYLLVALPRAGQHIVEKTYSLRDGLPGRDVRTTDDGLAKGEVQVSLRDRNNHLWFVTEQGVSRLRTISSQPAILRVAIIEDLRDVREGLKLLINGSPGFECVGAHKALGQGVEAERDFERSLHYRAIESAHESSLFDPKIKIKAESQPRP